MSLRAMISWPWPMDTALTSFFFFLPRCRIMSEGSAPGERMHTSGMRSLVSASVASRLSGVDSMYGVPSTSTTKSLAQSMVLSVRMDRTMRRRWKMSSLSSRSGTLDCSGLSWSYHCFHIVSLRASESGRSLKVCSVLARLTQCSHEASGIHSLGFLRTALMSSASPPLMSALKWSCDSLPAVRSTFIASMRTKISLWRSK
mmetsp:Transcript_13743/g.31849  ORF Transcript_13743/g.31849 Transcript_13743/m.31849 type:complete len:201 (-) Transcript_13743:11382-11984(-)